MHAEWQNFENEVDCRPQDFLKTTTDVRTRML